MFIERCHQRGLTLIELIVFIVVVSIGLAGILSVLNYTTRNSANPMILKQQVAIAESLLEEIESKAFTYCDPNDANVTTASAPVVSSTGCATTVQGLTAPTGKSRYDVTNPYDNVGDYGGFSMTGIVSPNTGNTVISGLGNYTASVALTNVGGNTWTNITVAYPSDVIRIDVTVTAPTGSGASPITLTGYRFRYAPNSP